jgi:hypothetical protein
MRILLTIYLCLNEHEIYNLHYDLSDHTIVIWIVRTPLLLSKWSTMVQNPRRSDWSSACYLLDLYYVGVPPNY